MLSKNNNKIRFINIALPLMVFIILMSILLLVGNSLNIVAKTTKNNFAYNMNVRDSIEALDEIFQRATSNNKIIVNTIASSYDEKKLYNEKYNLAYYRSMDPLIKAVTVGIPEGNGVWIQSNLSTPFFYKTFSWFERKNGKLINLRAKYERENDLYREITADSDPYYFAAVKAKKAFWSDIYKDPDTGIEMITLAEPIYKNGVLVGVSGVDVSLDGLKKSLKAVKLQYEGSEIFLLDIHKKPVISLGAHNQNLSKHSHSFLSLISAKDEGEDAIIEYYEEGETKTVVSLPLDNGYSLIMTFPNCKIFEGFNRLFIIIYLILATLVAFFITILYNRNKISKINKQLNDEATKLVAVFDATPALVTIKDVNGVYTGVNNKFAEFVGIAKEDIIGKTEFDIFRAHTANHIVEQDNIVKETRGVVYEEYLHINREGEKIILAVYRVPLFDSHGEFKGIVANAMDITKKAMEREYLEKAKVAAEAATAMKSNFLANMSHEIRTPMNGVIGFLQLLEETCPTEEQKEFITDAQKSSGLLLNIINEILDFSKIEAGKLKTDNISFDIRSVVEDVTVMNTSSACKKGIDINSLICSDVPQRVFGDPGRVKQILNNLVSNAIKFTQDGEVIIYVSQDLEDDGEVAVSFRVKDTGIGIEEDKLNLIFESFSQADASTTRKYGGTGLGLAISQKLAELMDGCISVKSVLNEGSIFTLTLPFVKEKTPQAVDNSTGSLNGANILIVDSNPTDLKIIQYYLNEANCIIKVACSPEEALGILDHENHNISAILIDCKMQNKDEVELSRRIKNNEKIKDIPLILYCSVSQRGDALNAKEQGFTGFLTKPLIKQDLIESIAIAINNKEPLHDKFVTKHLVKENKFDARAKILMVEDTELNCKFMLKLLSKVGLTCDIANEGRSAIEAVKSKKYDLILMDCQMPIMDGYEATKQIRILEGESSHTPIIAMTANAMRSDEEKCYQAGMDDYISKPVKIDKFLALISKYIKVESEELSAEKPKEESCFCENSIIEEMVSEIGFSKEEAVELFNQFIDFLPEAMRDIESAFAENDFERLKKAAHKLKGSSANLRIKKVSELSAQLEIESPNGDKECCSKLITEIKALIVCFNKIDM